MSPLILLLYLKYLYFRKKICKINVKLLQIMYYTLLIQNTVSKEVYTYNLENLNYDENIYYKFNIVLDDNTPDGEYQYLLFENPNQIEVVVNYNNVYDSKLYGDTKILVTFTNTLTNGTQILIAGKPIMWLSSGLIRIGGYKSNNYQYNKQNKYQVYDRK